MKINKPLNFVIPIYDSEDTIDAKGNKIYAVPSCWVHSTPIRQETFERWHLLLSKVFSSIYGEGLDYRVGPRVASLRLREIAEGMKIWDGPDGAEVGLVAEIRRLTNVIYPNKLDVVPWQMAVASIDPSDVSEVENAITFFTLASHIHRKHELRIILEGAAGIWSAQITSLTCTEFSISSRTSTEAGNSGETVLPLFLQVARSSIPS